MLTFDKLKLVSSIKNISIYDENAFEVKVKDGKVHSLLYYQETPFLLRIKIDYVRNELVVEFSGKVLGSDYPKLISIETIYQCFQNINELGFCRIDPDAMLNSEVVTCDVTKDIKWSDASSLVPYIQGHISNFKIYNCSVKCDNITIEKNVISRKCKKRMIIYNKEKEMTSVKNRAFVEKYNLDGAFKDIWRFEINLNSKEQIRNSLDLSDNKLLSVLQSEATPIASFIKDAVSPPTVPIKYNDRKSYLMALVLKDCDYDITKVDAKLRELYAPGTKFSKLLKPYRAALDAMSQEGNDTYTTLVEKLK